MPCAIEISKLGKWGFGFLFLTRENEGKLGFWVFFVGREEVLTIFTRQGERWWRKVGDSEMGCEPLIAKPKDGCDGDPSAR